MDFGSLEKIRYLPTGQIITPQIALQTKSHQYPSEWFKRNPGGKPRICALGKKITTEDLRINVASALEAGLLTSQLAVAYLCRVLSLQMEPLDEDWTSYGTTIGLKGTSISPLSLINVTEKEGMPGAMTGSQATAEDDKWMAMFLVSVYRIVRIGNVGYRTTVAKRLFDRIKNYRKVGDSGMTMDIVYTNYSKWLGDENYVKLIAAIDMFYYKYPMSDYSELRIGTLSSRYKDCASLMSYAHFKKITGMKSHFSMATFMFCPGLGTDLVRMFGPPEEISLEYSYFPYQVDLGLTNKSPYSAVLNPSLYFWANCVGTFLDNSRSRNARMLLEDDIQSVFRNAKIVAYALRNGHKTQILFDENVTPPEPGASVPMDDPPSDDEAETPKGKRIRFTGVIPEPRSTTDGRPWFHYAESFGGKDTPAMEEYFRTRKVTMISSREGTMGQWTSNNIA